MIGACHRLAPAPGVLRRTRGLTLILALGAMVLISAPAPGKAAEAPLPADAQAAFDRGLAAARQQQWDTAIKEFYAAGMIRLNAQIVFNLGLAHARAGREPGAIAWWRYYLSSTPALENAEAVRRELDAQTQSLRSKVESCFQGAVGASNQLSPASRRRALLGIGLQMAASDKLPAALDLGRGLQPPASPGERNALRMGYVTGLAGVIDTLHPVIKSPLFAESLRKALADFEDTPVGDPTHDIVEKERDKARSSLIMYLAAEGQADAARQVASQIVNPKVRDKALYYARAPGMEQWTNPEGNSRAVAGGAWLSSAMSLTQYAPRADVVAALHEAAGKEPAQIPVAMAEACFSGGGHWLFDFDFKERALERVRPYDGELKLEALAPRQQAVVYTGRGQNALYKDRYDDAIALFGKALEVRPDYAQAYAKRAEAYREKGDLDRAIADLGTAIRFAPEAYDLYNSRAYAYKAKGDREHAIADFSEVVRLNPDKEYPLTDRGIAFLKFGDLDRAIADFDQAIKLTQSYGYAYLNRGRAYSRKADYDRAIEDFSQAVRIWPTDPDSVRERGLAYLSKKDYARALADFDQAIKDKPDYAQAYYERCWVKARSGSDLDSALADCSEALRLSPSSWGFAGERGFVLLRLKRYAEAIAAFDTHLQKEPGNGFHLYGRGLAKRLRGDRSGGEADMAAAQKVSPRAADEYRAYGLR